MEYRCVQGHDLCNQMYPCKQCPYCERKGDKMKKLSKRDQKICDTWDMIDDSEPDISTEQLFARVSSICDCDDGDVSGALSARRDLEGK